MTYKEEERDLFTVPDNYYLVQCISADLAMGAGIAVQFNKRFNTKNNLKSKYGYLTAQWNKQNGFSVQDGRVFCLVTKNHYWEKPSKKTMFNALVDLKRKLQITEILEKEKLNIAMPKIGCGLDKMNWNVVKELISNTFINTDFNILICDNSICKTDEKIRTLQGEKF